MWGMETKSAPVVTGALGLITKEMEKSINCIPGDINIYTVQKITLLRRAHILRRVLSFK